MHALHALHVVSVNVARIRPILVGDASVATGIFKRPADGPVRVGAGGLAGDHVADERHHGGPDQAVYLYSAEDVAWWEAELGRPLGPGVFGENLTLSSFGPEPLRVGHRLRVGEALLEVTAPRIPCGKLAARMGDPAFARRFARAGRPGAYARVVEPGRVRAGDPVEATPPAERWPTVAEIAALWHAKGRDADVVRWMLHAPLAERTRATLERWLAA